MSKLDREDTLEKIQKTRREIQVYFALSLPGAIGTVYMLTLGGVLRELIQVAQKNIQPDVTAMVGFSVAFFFWLLPFEQSERGVSRMKMLVQEYIDQNGWNPIHYTKLEKMINAIMKIAWEKTPLPTES